ncbi:alpha-amylase family glycosyl hydrolase [Corynebacterium phocae]|uniref:alpha-amylase family glycosyl hydrolase n=1 Tax=Corynebacterium phocae TaxID=161895 RepID=UPI0009523C24|nr:alpha-amylase family glycosyl hydrolase [Corynebacterium phocae]KAA8721591.1 DUF3459 domain-containing protein [Corynebacterium phocae]
MDKAQWLERATFYQIYPQSFYDSNGDGIGDLDGITAKLPYLKNLGIEGIWLNPIFDSPFLDAGYDVRDYYTIATRYGDQESLQRLVHACHSHGIRLLLDLVPGHSSDQNPWFQQSQQPDTNSHSDRYIWTDSWFGDADGLSFVAGVAPRDGCYVVNFFHSQPALNYGFGQPRRAWQHTPAAAGPRANRAQMVDIIRFWLSQGVDGFRVDMADSLVKRDPGKQETIKTWQDILGQVRTEFPDAIFVSEWGNPDQALAAGFDMDFYLDWPGNGYNQLVRGPEPFFAAASARSAADFAAQYLPHYRASTEFSGGHFSLISGNHDCTRLAHHLNPTERPLFFLFLLTMPGVPFIYYGDEIGMTWHDLPTLEGGYTRTGSRTPMQWSAGPQSGFSAATDTYLPAFADTSVAAQEGDPQSLLHFVRELIALRRELPELHASAAFEMCLDDNHPRVLRYRRGELEVIINCSTRDIEVQAAQVLFATGQVHDPGLGAESAGSSPAQPDSGSTRAFRVAPLSGAVLRH